MTSYITTRNVIRATQLFAAYKVYRVFYPAKVKDLGGITVLITGAATGLGKALTLLLAARKDIKHLILWDIQVDELNNTVKEVGIINPGQKVTVEIIDLSKREKIYERAKVCIDSLGGNAPDVIVNNAGIISGGVDLMRTPDERIELESKINTLAHVWMTKAFLPKMISRGSGHFVNVASMAAYVAAPDMVCYASSKYGAKGFASGLAAELTHYGHKGIKVSCICPSHIATKLFAGFEVKGAPPTMTPEYVAGKIIQAIECETQLVQLPYPLLPFVPIIGISEMLGNLVLPSGGGSPMKNWTPEQADKIFRDIKLNSNM